MGPRAHRVYSVLLLILGLTAGASAAAVTTYKWVEADGTVQYSQTPPLGIPFEQIEAEPGAPPVAAQERLEATKKRVEELRTQRLERDKEAADVEKKKAEQMGRCRQAQSNLNTLRTGSRLRYTDAAGQVKFLSDEERQKRLSTAEEQVQKYCR